MHSSLPLVYPPRAPREVLEATLAGRGALLARLESDLVRTAEAGGARCELLIGPRGSGKSHLLALLAHRLAGAPDGPVVVSCLEMRGDSLAGLLARVLAGMPEHEGFP